MYRFFRGAGDRFRTDPCPSQRAGQTPSSTPVVALFLTARQFFVLSRKPIFRPSEAHFPLASAYPCDKITNHTYREVSMRSEIRLSIAGALAAAGLFAGLAL